MRELRGVACRQLWVKGTEVAQFACDRRRSSIKYNGKIADQGVSGCNAAKWHAAIQLERDDQLFASPRLTVVGRPGIQVSPHAPKLLGRLPRIKLTESALHFVNSLEDEVEFLRKE